MISPVAASYGPIEDAVRSVSIHFGAIANAASAPTNAAHAVGPVPTGSGENNAKKSTCGTSCDS